MPHFPSEVLLFSVGRVPNPTGAGAPKQTQFAFNLADLQAVAVERFGITPAETLASAISLYERGLISYPRVAERLLELYTFVESAQIVRDYRLLSQDDTLDVEYRGPAWVSEVQGAHTGIALKPISVAAVFGVAMSERDERIYGLVHERFMSLFKRPTPSPAGR